MVAIISKNVVEKPVHVFVLGVSRYRHLEDGSDPSDTGIASGLEQLTSAARSASEFAAWVIENIPEERLASLYLNVAPSENEALHPAVKDEVGSSPSATRAIVVEEWEAFYHKCRNTTDATAYIYVAGHGVQLNIDGAILFLEDFGTPLKRKFWAALDLKAMHRTLRGSDAAALQFWFVDCCREKADAAAYNVSELGSAYTGFDVPEGLCVASPMFFATLPRESAWARTNGVSLFNEALLKALRKSAATESQHSNGSWCVTTSSLVAAVNEHVKRASGAHRQEVYLGGHQGLTTEILHVFAEPPNGNLSITLKPTEARDVASARIDHDDVNVLAETQEWPITCELPAGLYIIYVRALPPYNDAIRSVKLIPQGVEKEVELA
jgi:hypothetical protein